MSHRSSPSGTPRELLPVATARATTRLALGLLREHRGPLLLAVGAFAVQGLCAVVAPWVLGLVVDTVIDGGSQERIVHLTLVIVAASLVGALASASAVASLARSGEPALASLREVVLSRALHLDTQRLERAGVGDLLSRVGDDVRMIATSLKDVVPLVVESIVAVAFTAAGLFALDWRLGLAGFAAAPFYVLALRWYLPRSAPLYREERVAQGERAEALVGGLQGAATLRAYGHESAHVEGVASRSRDALRISVRVYWMFSRFFGRNNRAELIGLSLVLLTGFLLARGGAVTVGAVTAAALYFHRLFNPIGALVTLFDEVQSTGASLARLAGVAALPVSAAPTTSTTSGGTLVASGLGHAYVEGRPVLHDVSLTLRPGERVAVVGATGAGKTTLGLALAGVLRPVAGSISLGGASYNDLGERAVREQVVLVSQDVHVFSGTVRDSVTLARPEASDEQVRAALELTSAWDWVTALPEGLDTVVGDEGRTLTPAQAQQLALARVTVRDPAVVVLDEATAEAGSAGARVLEDAAFAVTEGRSALIVAHRLTQAVRADRVLVMHQGRIVEDGTHAELVAGDGLYRELWEAWTAR